MKNYQAKLVGWQLNTLFKIAPQHTVQKISRYFSSVNKRILSAEKEQFLTTAVSRELMVKDCVIRAYFWQGDPSRKILLAHGWESSAARWEFLIRALQERNYTIIALDAPGHGYSQGRLFDHDIYGAAIRSLVNQYQIHEVIGHSLGGFTLLLEYDKKPLAPVGKMILMGTPIDFKKYQLGFFERMGLSRELRTAFEKYAENKYGHNFSVFSFLDREEGPSVPVLFIHDKQDKTVPYDSTAQLAQQWKHARLYTTAGLGHGLRDQEVNKVILDFLK